MRHITKNDLIKSLSDERGGVHILILALLGAVAAVFIWIVSINWMMHTSSIDKAKTFLDISTSAASKSVDATQLARGNIVWDPIDGTANFYKYLRLNLKLDATNTPLAGSFLTQAPIVHSLEFVTSGTYPVVLNRTVSVYVGTNDETTRNIQVTVYGPSIVAVVEIRQDLIGRTQKEPIILSSVASVRYR